MSKTTFAVIFCLLSHFIVAQHIGIVRKNYFSNYFDTLMNTQIEVLDSSTIRLGTIDPLNGLITNLNTSEYNMAINLNGATVDPYNNRYYIGSGFNLLTFDINSGDLLNTAPISGPLPSASFQNYRFNPSDSTIYGMVPHNYYSSYFDSTSMSVIEVLDSSVIRFASIEPLTGNYTLIGNASYNNIYTLAGNSIYPHQMIYYYSAVDTLVGIDLYTGNPYSVVPIQLPNYAIFENIAYSCADTSIYGITRQNHVSMVYDSLFMEFIQVVDSTTFRLSKIDPNSGVVTFISPFNIQAGGNLTGGAFIDPSSMTYFFNDGNNIIGVSLISGLITSSVATVFPSGEIAFNMMRNTENCYGASKMRNNTLEITQDEPIDFQLYPNPAFDVLNIETSSLFQSIQVTDITGKKLIESSDKSLNIETLPNGLYMAKLTTVEGAVSIRKFIKE